MRWEVHSLIGDGTTPFLWGTKLSCPISCQVLVLERDQVTSDQRGG